MTTYEVRGNPNYAAEVIEVKSLVPLANCDNVVGLPWGGYQAIVSKDIKVGDILVVFPAESQLSDAYASENNLYRHAYEFERAILAVWNKNPKFARSTLLRDFLATATATIVSTPSIDLDQRIGNEHESAPDSGSKTTQNGSKRTSVLTENDMRSTNVSAARVETLRPVVVVPESTTSLSTVSLPNGMTSGTLTLEDVANFVASGGKFSALITAMIREWFGASSVKDATSHSVALETMRQVFDALSHISNDLRFEDFSKNADPTAKGYIEDNRRVKAMKFRGHRSDALAMPFSSLYPFEPAYVIDMQVGNTFDHVNGVEICRKYEIPVKANSMAGKTPAERAFRRVDEKMLPAHLDTEQWFRNEFKVPEDAWITVSQKVHGTSWRGANTLVRRELNWLERLAKRLGIKVAETEYDYVFGSRKVIKDPHNPNQDHFYGFDLWGAFGQTIEHLIPKNVVIYGELIGWLPDGAPIQAGYTYRVPKGEVRLLVYRVAVVTEDGGLYDLSRGGVEEFCATRGLDVVPLLWQGFKRDFVAEDWLDKKYHPRYAQAVPLSEDSPVDEGVVVQVEGVVPFNLKCKSPAFLSFESKRLDTGEADLEATA